MNRDCGKGKLVPILYTLMYCIGRSDTDIVKNIADPFTKEYDEVLATLPAYSNIRMYAWDKQGYSNCIRSSCVDKDGVAKEITNRLTELQGTIMKNKIADNQTAQVLIAQAAADGITKTELLAAIQATYDDCVEPNPFGRGDEGEPTRDFS